MILAVNASGGPIAKEMVRKLAIEPAVARLSASASETSKAATLMTACKDDLAAAAPAMPLTR